MTKEALVLPTRGDPRKISSYASYVRLVHRGTRPEGCCDLPVNSEKVEHRCRMIFAGVPSSVGFHIRCPDIWKLSYAPKVSAVVSSGAYVACIRFSGAAVL